MHAVVMESLEEYLSGLLEPAAQRNIEAHLSSCEKCRQELESMQEVSQWLGGLRLEEALAPPPGFYAQVMQRVGDRHASWPLSSFFALDFAFGRRLAFASLLTLAVLGSYLVSREAEYPTGLSPEAVMAQQDSPAFDTVRAPENMLVTLATYEP